MLPIQSTKQQQKLTGLELGHLVTVTVTNAAADAVLEFLHDDDETWHIYPGFKGVLDENGTLVESFVCNSASMRLNFEADPGSYEISHTLLAQSNF